MFEIISRLLDQVTAPPAHASYGGLPLPAIADLYIRALRRRRHGQYHSSYNVSQMRDAVMGVYKKCTRLHDLLPASDLTLLMDWYLPTTGKAENLRGHCDALQDAISQFESYLEFCDEYLTAAEYVHKKLPLAEFAKRAKTSVFPKFGTDEVGRAIGDLRSRVQLLQWEAHEGNAALAERKRLAEEHARQELQELKNALSEKKTALAWEQQRREEAERNKGQVKDSCTRLRADSQAAIESIEAEILQLQSAGLQPALIEEEIAKLSHRKNGLLREIDQLSDTLTNLE
jgi:hypothetical protein